MASLILFKSVLHNLGVLLVGMGVALIGNRVDAFLGFGNFRSLFWTVWAYIFLAVGFALRLWATFYFYEHRMKVISLVPQAALITSGPFRYSRNPLYLGGNVFIFFGAALWFGSPTALLFTALHLPFVDLFIRREERQLEAQFGEAWVAYKNRTRRWI